MDGGTPHKLALLTSAPLFAGLPEATLRELEAALQPRVVRAREWLFREGEPSDRLCVVRSGRLRVVVESGDVAMVARVVGPGAMLGELGVLTGSPRSASVQAVRDSELLELGAAEFDSLLVRSPGLAVRLARQLAAQLQASGGLDLPEAPAAIIAVVPAHSSLPIEGFRDVPSGAFVRLASVLVVRDSISEMTRCCGVFPVMCPRGEFGVGLAPACWPGDVVLENSDGYAQALKLVDVHARGGRAFAGEGTGSFAAGLTRFLAG